MDLLWLVTIPILVAYLVGSLPLGAWLIRKVSGFDPRDVNPHLLGVENVYRLVGGWVAVGTFTLDVLKGVAGVAAGAVTWSIVRSVAVVPGEVLVWAPYAPGSMVAASGGGSPDVAIAAAAGLLGVLLGHLNPLRFAGKGVPRGRGNGVLLGGLTGLFIYGAAPFWLLALPVVLYAGSLARTGFVALATLVALTGLGVATLAAAVAGLVTWSFAAVILAAVAVVAWRHKAAVSRIRDGTEARLGEPNAVRGLDSNSALAAFLVHPLSLKDVWQPRSQRWLRTVLNRFVEPGIVPLGLLKRLFLSVRPQLQGVIDGVTLPDGRDLRVMLISAPLLPDQFRTNPDDALRLAIQGARFAHQLGAEVVGLGAFWSTIGDKGTAVQEAVPEIVVTNGGAYTAATVRAAVPGLLRRFQVQGTDLKKSTAAVVGANGVVAFGVARLIAPDVGRLYLIGRDREKLNRSASTLMRKYTSTEIIATTDLAVLAEADLIFTATSDPNPVVFSQHVKPGAWVYDLGRPADVDDSVRDVPGVELVPGGVVRPPGAMRTRIDLRFGTGQVPACLAETMILTATRAYDRRSLGNTTRSADIDFYLREGERLGFEIITRDARVAEAKVKA
ncbi:MAG TPA: glycerol-3-phosphate acyltransferase [Trueperaceae bacterium]|nr:glycerol-3-phosphate acyltransferase [Trueperaceae bacterium]